ncbi:MAG: SDR family oxidoreductase [Eudoraea sp.]|nr:SDR family oxidoreductase [Eudoraea sp.]MBT8294492.1 SDR family oxidoreductase [Eudoraea sp.]NNL03233.1 SDR family oxidoreductase [Eudoraea sp.]
MDLGLKNKVVVISGAAGMKGSIGETILHNLAKEGAIPAVIDRNDRAIEYIEEIRKKGIDALFCKTDVTDPEQIENAIEKISKKYGRIDAVINNVGVNDGAGLDATHEEFMNSLKLNLVSFFLIVKYAVPFLKESKGNILNIGSKVALTGQGGTSGYAAAKGGVLGLTREWAVDLIQYGIRSNAIIIAESWTPSYKSWIESIENGDQKLKSIIKKIPLENRMTTPQEIANTCLFTISDKSSHTTGQFITVDGGYVHLDRSLLTQEND